MMTTTIDTTDDYFVALYNQRMHLLEAGEFYR
jgi:hypothetical protein